MNAEPGPDEQSPARFYRLMLSKADAVDAVEQVVGEAQRELRIFDSTPRSLHDWGFGGPARIEALRALLLADRGHRLRLVLHDTRSIEQVLPRVVDLVSRFSGQIQIHRTVGQAADARDSMIIADECHFWRRLHIDLPRSVITLNDATDTRPFIERFEEIWERSEPAVSGSTLGL
ncbi:MAG: hypothetical protein ABI790_00010 [Betaproteobacteria bacterium]